MKNIFSRSVILGIVAFFSFNIISLAHGIDFETAEEPPVITVKASFSRTAPLVDAVVKIFAPGKDNPFQTGRTDKAGYFAFMPDVAGEWTVTVDDERGHRDREKVLVPDSFFNGEKVLDETFADEAKELLFEIEEADTEKSFPVFYSIITGIALIFGLTGIVYGIKARQALLKNRNSS